LRKLNRTCNSEKREFLIAKFPTVCDNIITVNKKVEAANGTLCERYIETLEVYLAIILWSHR
jgi:hypothetical protein